MINLLQVSLHQKDIELQEWEDKHKKFIEKAKSVVKCMDTKNVALCDTDTSVLQNRLLKANKEISDLKVCISEMITISIINKAKRFCNDLTIVRSM